MMTILAGALPAGAAPETAPNPGETPAAAKAVSTRPYPFHSVVFSVDAKTQTFQMGKKKINRVHILPATRVMKGDGNPGTFELLAPGEEVRGSVRKRPDGDLDAVSVKIGPKPVAVGGKKK